MAAQWADFPTNDRGIYDNNINLTLDGPWASYSNCALLNDPDPNIGAQGIVLKVGGSPFGGGHIRKVLTGGRTTVGMSFRIFLSQIPPNTEQVPMPAWFADAGNVVLCHVGVTPTGSLQVRKGGYNGTIVGETSGPVLTANAWTHLSVKATFGSGETGSISIEREGLPILTLEDVDIGAGPCAQVHHYNRGEISGFATHYFIKDSFIWDGLGSRNNDHPGSVAVYRRRVVADVSSGWSRTSGSTDYELLNETPPDDNGFIYAGLDLPAPSVMELEDLPPEVISVRGILMVARQRKSDGGDCLTQVGISPDGGATWDNGADRAITTAFTYWGDWSELDPDTSDPWTPLAFNNARIRINRTA